jgi:hypothetical protein
MFGRHIIALCLWLGLVVQTPLTVATAGSGDSVTASICQCCDGGCCCEQAPADQPVRPLPQVPVSANHFSTLALPPGDAGFCAVSSPQFSGRVLRSLPRFTAVSRPAEVLFCSFLI